MKSHLINIISKYKNIIENKETDKNTNLEKNSAWDKVTDEFNATSSSNYLRSKDSLKRFYDNKKKELRKKVADKKMEQKKTGGGLPPPEQEDPFEEVLMSITNKKTVYGLGTAYGGDVSSDDEESNKIKDGPHAKSYDTNDIEYVYETDNGINQYIEGELSPSVTHNAGINYEPTDLQKPISSALKTESQKENKGLNANENGTWKKYKATDFQKPISSSLRTESQKETMELAVKYAPKDNQARSTNNTMKRSPLQEVIENKKESASSPKARRRSTPALNRRRPTIQVKALTSSHMSEKYNQLLDARLQIADYTKDRLIQERNQADTKHKKEMDLLDLQISCEKERLKKLTRKEY